MKKMSTVCQEREPLFLSYEVPPLLADRINEGFGKAFPGLGKIVEPSATKSKNLLAGQGRIRLYGVEDPLEVSIEPNAKEKLTFLSANQDFLVSVNSFELAVKHRLLPSEFKPVPRLTSEGQAQRISKLVSMFDAQVTGTPKTTSEQIRFLRDLYSDCQGVPAIAAAWLNCSRDLASIEAVELAKLDSPVEMSVAELQTDGPMGSTGAVDFYDDSADPGAPPSWLDEAPLEGVAAKPVAAVKSPEPKLNIAARPKGARPSFG